MADLICTGLEQFSTTKLSFLWFDNTNKLFLLYFADFCINMELEVPYIKKLKIIHILSNFFLIMKFYELQACISNEDILLKH